MQRFLLTVVLAALSMAAHADTIDDFVFTGEGHAVTFSLPASPTDAYPSIGAGGNDAGFNIAIPDFVIDGVPYATGAQFIRNYTVNGILFDRFSPNGLYPTYMLLGALLFSGPSARPTFLNGTFQLADFQAPPGVSNINWTATITPEGAPVPEPSTMLLILTGTCALLAGAKSPRFSTR